MDEMQCSRQGLFSAERATDPPPTSATASRGTKFEYPPSADDWEIIKHKIHQMYVIQKQPLKDVRKSLDRLGFRATDRMIKSRLRTWGFVKNAKKEDWGLLAVLHHRRKTSGRPATVFEIHGHRKTVRDLHRFIRNQSKSPEEFLADHLPQWHQDSLPDYIRAWTPEPEDIKPDTPPSAAESPAEPPPTLAPNPPSPVVTKPTVLKPHVPMLQYHPRLEQYRRPLSPEPVCYQHPNFVPGSNAIKVDRSGSMTKTIIEMPDPEPSQIPTPPLIDPEQCHHMAAELEACGTQLLKPQPLVSKIGRNDMQFWSWLSSRYQATGHPAEDMDDVQICTRCRQPSFQHFRSLDNFEPMQDSPNRNLLNDCHDETWHLPVSTRDEGAWLWVSRCFLACMCFSRGDEKMGQAALSDANSHFEKLLRRQDRLLLTAAVLMISILHMHDQNEIAYKIMASAKAVADQVFRSVNDPIRTTMAYFMHSANESFAKSNITSNTMQDAYLSLKKTYREDHPYVIAARCNYSWMLKYEDKLEAAERNLREVYKASCAVFTEEHMQSVIALSLTAGCLNPQSDRRDECISLYRAVIKRTEDILGANHPYRLEAKRRLAGRLRGIDGKQDEILRLHKEVLWGRAKMLGRKHSYTSGARRVYEDDLKDLNRWQIDGKPSPEQLELTDLFSRDPSEAWVNISADGHGVVAASVPELDDDNDRRRSKDSSCRTPSPATSDDYAAY